MKFHFKFIVLIAVLVEGIISKSFPDESQNDFLQGQYDVDLALKAYYKQLAFNGTDIQKIIAKQFLQKLKQNEDSPFPGTNPVKKGGGSDGILQVEENAHPNDGETGDMYNALGHLELLPDAEELELQKAIEGQSYISEESLQRDTDIALKAYLKEMETNGTEIDREIAKAYFKHLGQVKNNTQDVNIDKVDGILSNYTSNYALKEQPDSTGNTREDSLKDTHPAETGHPQSYHTNSAIISSNSKTNHSMGIPIHREHGKLREDDLSTGQGSISGTDKIKPLKTSGDITKSSVVPSVVESEHNKNDHGYVVTDIKQKHDMHSNTQSEDAEKNLELKDEVSSQAQTGQSEATKDPASDTNSQTQSEHVHDLKTPKDEEYKHAQSKHDESTVKQDDDGQTETELEHENSNVKHGAEESLQIPSIHMGANIKLGDRMHSNQQSENSTSKVKPPKHIELNLKPEHNIHIKPETGHINVNMQPKGNVYPKPTPRQVDVFLQRGNAFLKSNSGHVQQHQFNMDPKPNSEHVQQHQINMGLNPNSGHVQQHQINMDPKPNSRHMQQHQINMDFKPNSGHVQQHQINIYPKPNSGHAGVDVQLQGNLYHKAHVSEDNNNQNKLGLIAKQSMKSTKNTRTTLHTTYASTNQPSAITKGKNNVRSSTIATSLQTKPHQSLPSRKKTTVTQTVTTRLQTKPHQSLPSRKKTTVTQTVTTRLQTKPHQSLPSRKKTTVTQSVATPLQAEPRQTVSSRKKTSTTLSVSKAVSTRPATSRKPATHSPARTESQQILFKPDHTTKKSCNLPITSYGHYDQSAVIGAAVGGAFVGSISILALVYCRQKCRRYRLGDYRQVPLEYDFELNPRLKTSNF